jgi:hypothetical protein
MILEVNITGICCQICIDIHHGGTEDAEEKKLSLKEGAKHK